MKKSLAPLIIIAIAIPAFAADEEGFTPLFNGKDLTGWVKRGGDAIYTAADGAVVGTSVPNTPNAFLCTERDYADFILEFEFFGHPKLNSGVQIRSESRDDYQNGRVHGYQIELEQEEQERDWSGGIYDEARRGWLVPMKDDEAAGKAFGEQGVKLWKEGDWNHVRVEAKGGTIQTFLNGQPRATLNDDMTLKGFIALQVHGVGDNQEPMTVRWRNIRIKELEPTSE